MRTMCKVFAATLLAVLVMAAAQVATTGTGKDAGSVWASAAVEASQSPFVQIARSDAPRGSSDSGYGSGDSGRSRGGQGYSQGSSQGDGQGSKKGKDKNKNKGQQDRGQGSRGD